MLKRASRVTLVKRRTRGVRSARKRGSLRNRAVHIISLRFDDTGD